MARPKNEIPQAPINLVLPKDLKDRLFAHCEAEYITASWLIRKLIRGYLDQKGS